MATQVREATGADVAILAHLNRAVQDLHVNNLPGYFKPANEAAVAQWFSSQLENPDCRTWIAEIDGAPAGYILTNICIKPENALRVAIRFCEIDQIAVARQFRLRGVARALVERVLEHARAQWISEVELTSWSFNTEAHEAFRALGFTEKILRFGRNISQI